jgi:uncharacterized surface protein with fasciclin (FAS1) repeats
MNRKFAAAGAALSLTILLGACSTSAPASTPAAPMSASSSPTASSTAMSESDIVETAAAAGDFKTLTAALKAAGLDEALKGPGPFTVFAPTDAAFAKLPEGTVETLLKDPKGQLAEILKYHVVAGEVMAADVAKMDGQKVKTVQGAELTVEVSGDKVVLVDAAGNRVNVIKTDITASNGVIHVIDAVLIPTKK